MGGTLQPSLSATVSNRLALLRGFEHRGDRSSPRLPHWNRQVQAAPRRGEVEKRADMTEDSYIEERVRRTLNAVAGQPIPSAPPAFEPGRPRTRHPVRIVSVALVVVAVAAAVTLALIFGPHSGLGKNP